jgi:replicative DNA helicase
LDRLILKLLKHRHHYQELVPGLPHDALHPKTQLLVQDFGAWFNISEGAVIDMEDFKSWFFTIKHRNLSDKEKHYYNLFLNRCIPDASIGESEAISVKLIELGLAARVANLCQKYNDGDEIDIIQAIGLEHGYAIKKQDIESEELHITTDIGELLEEDSNNAGLRFGLSCLRENIRPLRRSDFIILGGRPDTGKTSFLASELPHLIGGRDSRDRPVLWFNNEGIGRRIIKRLYQSALSCTTEDLLSLREAGTLDTLFLDKFGGINPYRVIDAHAYGTAEVEKAVRIYNPCLVIFDMLDNIAWPGQEKLRTDQLLEKLYQWARELGVIYDFPVIATSQISADVEQQADTQCWPPMHSLKDSKTGKQGTADTIIMIGRSRDPEMEYCRYISTPKNKLAITGGVIRQPVQFDKLRAQYKD